MTLAEIAERIGMTCDPKTKNWSDPGSIGRPMKNRLLRNHLLTGDRPWRIAANVLRAASYDYELSGGGGEQAVFILLGCRWLGLIYKGYHPDEPTAILAAAEALPSPNKET
jgi:hypothetical protein